MDPYVAHIIKDTKQIQTVDRHCKDAVRLMLEKCPVEELTCIAWLTSSTVSVTVRLLQ